MSFLREMRWRGLVADHTPELEELLAAERVTGYIGFDPTAASLHVGSLLPILNLVRLQRAGHRPIALAGGGTGLIGDPSGKRTERALLDGAEVEDNLRGIERQLAHFLDFDDPDTGALLVDNADWLCEMPLLDFLRDVGKHFTVNRMVTQEAVKLRLDSEVGLSFTEFSYSLLQAYDFLELYDRHGCKLQMGGTDQWGNILFGADLIRRRREEKAHGLVSPLITNASGTKFGKTEAGTVWLDPKLTPPYHYYQFWLNTGDDDAVRYLRFFTFLGEAEVGELAEALAAAPQERAAQRRLAAELTRMTHGDDALARAVRVSDLLFGHRGDLYADDLLEAFGDAPSTELSRADFDAGLSLSQLLADAGAAPSRNQARRLIGQGGVYINEERVEEDVELGAEHTVEGRVILLRRGKKSYSVVRIVG